MVFGFIPECRSASSRNERSASPESPPDDGGAFVSWIEEGDKSNRLLARFISAAGVAEPVSEIAQGSTQSLGYPRLLHAGKETWIAWGNSASTKVQTARLTK